ncbi:PaaI family thioesterase [Pseudalkalibacillus caeni]|nr:PaaI family thioesterase [Pseudalkalibacillus caeni]
MANKREALESLFKKTIMQANEEEMEVLEDLLKSLQRKQNGLHRTYIASMLGIKSRLLDDGTYESIIPIKPIAQNTLNIIHGGITSTLIDTAMGSLVNQHLPVNKAAVTLDMKINFLSKGIGTFIRCNAEIVHKEESRWVTRADVYRNDEKLIATATGNFFVVDRT